MNEYACHLVDRVLPRAPYRQWVLTLPPELARAVAFDAPLARKVWRILAAELSRWYVDCGEALGVEQTQTGCVMAVQRFADGAKLSPHAHVLCPGGVFHEIDGDVRFVSLPPPSDVDVEVVVNRIEAPVRRLLGRVHRCRDGEEEREHQLLLNGALLSADGRIRTETSKARRTRKKEKKRLCVGSAAGFALHASVIVAAHDRAGLERLCRYLIRPPIADGRLHRRDDGKIEIRLKRAWRNGVTALVFEPVKLIARLAALIPLPHTHTLKLFGVFAPRHALRERVVPRPPTPTPERPTAPRRPGQMAWAELLQRVWKINGLRCPWCAGRMYIAGVVRDPDAVTAIIAAVHAADAARAATPTPTKDTRPRAPPSRHASARPHP